MSMQTIVPETQDEILEFQQWYLKKTIEIERDRRKLEDDKQRLEMQRAKLERERKDFSRQKEADARFRAQEEYVLQMKQQVRPPERAYSQAATRSPALLPLSSPWAQARRLLVPSTRSSRINKGTSE